MCARRVFNSCQVLTDKTTLVVLSHVNHVTGEIANLKEVVEVRVEPDLDFTP